jgi:hypothetical protein
METGKYDLNASVFAPPTRVLDVASLNLKSTVAIGTDCRFTLISPVGASATLSSLFGRRIESVTFLLRYLL